MKQWKKTLHNALASLAIALSAPCATYAFDFCNPCYDPCSFGGFELGFDFLWWKPCIDNLEYAATDHLHAGSTEFHYKTICTNWEPGIRVRLAKADQWCRWQLIGTYTFIQTDDSNSGSALANTLLHPELEHLFSYTHASANWNANYHNLDLLLGYPITINDCQSITPQFGVAALFFDQKIRSHANSPELTPSESAEIVWKSDYWGLGLKLGTHYEAPICRNFKFIANLSTTLVVGDFDDSNKQTVTAGDTPIMTNIEFEEKVECHLIPGYHILAGTEYTVCWCERIIDLRLGYEFLQWHHIPNPRRFFIPKSSIGECAGSTSNHTATLGFHGMFIGINMRF